ncbi:metal ABC transporter permease, partial [Acidobacteriota bacterium]
VVALMIAPPATAYLLTDRLSVMIVLSGLTGMAGAVSGYWLAHALDASIAGAMASMCGVLFLLAFLLAPRRGLLSIALRRQRQKWEFAQAMLAIHLFNHEGLPDWKQERRMDHMHRHMRWEPAFARDVVRRAERNGYVLREEADLILTDQGRHLARETIVNR